MAKHVFVVLTNPVAGQEDKFNSWYTGTHVPEILKTAGIVSAQRYKLACSGGGGIEPQRYLCIYECESDDIAALHAQLAERMKTGDVTASDALDAGTVLAGYYSPITERVTP